MTKAKLVLNIALKQRGMTLLEIMIVLVLVGGALAMVTPALAGVSGAHLRKSATMVQALCNEAYTRAALTSDTHRAVFDLDANTFWLEKTQGGAVAPRERIWPVSDKSVASEDAKGELDKLDEDLERLVDSRDEEDQAKLNLLKPQTWSKTDDESGEAHALEGDIRFRSVWGDHLKDRLSGGVVALMFYPGGHTQEAHIVLEDGEEEDDTLTLVLEPLTGEIFVENDTPEIPSEER